MPQLDVATFPSLIFWLLISFGLLYMGLRYLVVPKLSNIVEGRLLKIESSLETARDFQKQANALHVETERKIHDARRESQQQLSKINSEISDFIQLKDREFSEQFHKRQLEMDRAMEEQRLQVESELKGYLSGMIEDVLGHLSLKSISEDQIKKAIKGRDS